MDDRLCWEFFDKYNYISEYKNNNHLYWVLYNEDITEENFKTDNVFVITTIN